MHILIHTQTYIYMYKHTHTHIYTHQMKKEQKFMLTINAQFE